MNVNRFDGHGGWIATSEDLTNFLISLPTILRPKSMAILKAGSKASPNYGKGFFINPNHGNIWHTGSISGTGTIMIRYSSGVCTSLLVNGLHDQAKN